MGIVVAAWASRFQMGSDVWQGNTLSGSARRGLVALARVLRDRKEVDLARQVDALLAALAAGQPRDRWPDLAAVRDVVQDDADLAWLASVFDGPGRPGGEARGAHLSAALADVVDLGDVVDTKGVEEVTGGRVREVMVHVPVDPDAEVGEALCGRPRVRLVPCTHCLAIWRRDCLVHVRSPRRFGFVLCGLAWSAQGQPSQPKPSPAKAGRRSSGVKYSVDVLKALAWAGGDADVEGDPCPSCLVNLGRWDSARRARSAGPEDDD